MIDMPHPSSSEDTLIQPSLPVVPMHLMFKGHGGTVLVYHFRVWLWLPLTLAFLG